MRGDPQFTNLGDKVTCIRPSQKGKFMMERKKCMVWAMGILQAAGATRNTGESRTQNRDEADTKQFELLPSGS